MEFFKIINWLGVPSKYRKTDWSASSVEKETKSSQCEWKILLQVWKQHYKLKKSILHNETPLKWWGEVICIYFKSEILIINNTSPLSLCLSLCKWYEEEEQLQAQGPAVEPTSLFTISLITKPSNWTSADGIFITHQTKKQSWTQIMVQDAQANMHKPFSLSN